MQKKFIHYLVVLFVAIGLSSCQQTFEYDINDIPYFKGLDEPDADKGFQVHVPPFPIVGNYEREMFIRMPIGNTEDIYVTKFHALCRPGTHHLIAYGYQNEDNPAHPPIGLMRDQNLPDGRGNITLTMGSGAMYCGAQEPEFIQQFPPGVAVRIPANATIDVNSHYFNLTNETIFGEVFLNMETIPADSVTELLEIDNIDNDDVLFLPKGETTDIEYTEIFDETTQIRQMFSHMHKRGVLFEVFRVGGVDDGELVYAALDYQHPPYKFFDEPLLFFAGEGLRTKVRYINNTERDIQFGVTSEDEMGILFYSEIK